MAMNRQRRTANISNIFSYDDAGNIVIKDYSQVIRYSWNGTIHGFIGPVSVSSVSAAVTDTDKFLVSDGGVLKFRTGVEVLSDIGGQPLLTNPVTGTGVAGQVAYWNGTNSQTGSNNLFLDAANSRLGIGTNTPAYKLDVSGNQRVAGSISVSNSNGLLVNNTLNATTNGDQQTGLGINVSFVDGAYTGVNHYALQIAGSGYSQLTANVGAFNLPTNGFGLQVGWNKSNGGGETSLWFNKSAGSTGGLFIGENLAGTGTYFAKMSSSTGNLVLQNGGTFTDSGQRLQVQGTTLLNGNVTFSSSTGMFWDAANNRLGIGTNSPGYVFEIKPVGVTNDTNSYIFETPINTNNKRNIIFSQPNKSITIYGFNSDLGGGFFRTDDGVGGSGITEIFSNDNYNASLADITFAINGSRRMRIFRTGNIVLQNGGTFTDSGQRLQVQGTGYFSDSVGIGSTSLTGYGLRVSKTITGSIISGGIYNDGQVQSDVTSAVRMYRSQLNIVNSVFTIADVYHYIAEQGTIGASSTVTNQYGFITGDLTKGTNNYGFYGSVSAGTNRWNLYMAGTANNYLAGSLGIGATSLTNVNLRIEKNITGNTVAFNIGAFGTVLSDVTNQVRYVATSVNTQAASFTLGNAFHFYAEQGTIGLGSSITNQYGYFVNNTLIGATNNYGFYGNIPSGTNRWNLYMAGTADNYLAGKLLIGTTTVGTYSLDVNGTARVQGTSYFSDRVGFNSTGTSNVTLRNELQISGSSSSYGYYTSSVIQSGVTNQASYFLVLPQTQAASFTLSRLSGFEVTALGIGGGSTITEASAFYGGISSGFNHWNLYMAGTANNYMAGNLLIGTTSDQGYRVQITGTGDNMLNVWGATAPSIRIDNAASGATQRFVFGLATATNNFITGAVAGDICMTTQSSNPLLFGANALEVMRITTSRNLLINKTADGGQKLQVSGKVNFASLPTSSAGLAAGDIWNNGGVLNIV